MNNTMSFPLPKPMRGDLILALLQQEMRSEFALAEDPIMDFLDGNIRSENPDTSVLFGYDNAARSKGCPLCTVWTRGLPAVLPLPKKYAGRPIRILLDVDTAEWHPGALYDKIIFVVTYHRRGFLPWRHHWHPVNLDEARYIRVCLDNVMYRLRARLGWMDSPITAP